MGKVQTAMIIDDDVELGLLLAAILEHRKIHALAVHSLPEAQECLTIMKPSIIFLDNSFPDGLGVNFIKHIRTADDDIKIVMITGDTNSWVEQKACEEGVHYFLHKPLTTKIIDNVLDKMNMKRH